MRPCISTRRTLRPPLPGFPSTPLLSFSRHSHVRFYNTTGASLISFIATVFARTPSTTPPGCMRDASYQRQIAFNPSGPSARTYHSFPSIASGTAKESAAFKITRFRYVSSCSLSSLPCRTVREVLKFCHLSLAVREAVRANERAIQTMEHSSIGVTTTSGTNRPARHLRRQDWSMHDGSIARSPQWDQQVKHQRQ